MKRVLLLSSVLTVLCFTLTAQNIERVYTKNGDIYEGFIAEQIPGEYITFFSEKATITIPSNDVKNLRNDYRPFSSLSESAKTWFRANQDTVSVLLTSFELGDKMVDNVVITHKNDKETKYISFASQTYKIQWESISKTSKSVDFNVPYGTRDIVTLITGERLIGGIVEQVIGESLIVKTEDGKERIVLAEDVLSVRTEIVDKKVDIWKQVQMLDRIFVDGEEPIEGFIASRVIGVMGQRLNVIRYGTNIERTIPLSDIKKYQKFWNKDYAEYQPPIIDTTKVVTINGKEVELTETFKDENYIYVSDTLSIAVKAGEELLLNVQNYPCERTVQVYRTESVKFASKEDKEHYRGVYQAIKLDADPIYESAFIKDDNNQNTSNILIRKEGIYILSFKDLESVIVIDVKQI